jgi:eukaryotic-like serine/threonine-protein kinase
VLCVHAVSAKAEATTALQPTPEDGNLPGATSAQTLVAQSGSEDTIASPSPMSDEPLEDLDPASAPRDFGPYRVIRKIGSGGMGVVYQAQHRETGDLVAIKTVPVESDPTNHKHLNGLVGLRREIHALRRVQHPGIVCVVDNDVTDGLPWVAMRLLQGRTLDKHLEALRTRPTSKGATPDRTMLTVIRRLCTPLAFLHGQGLVHRDLKPANIFLQDDGRPMLFDLGLAVHFGGVGGREELDNEQTAGTMRYMAPEQLRGDLVDARADLYALGCILYEWVTGEPPSILSHPPIQPSHLVSGVPRKLNNLILKLLEKLPQDRIGYAADVAEELVALGAEAEHNDGPPSRAYLYRPQIAGRTNALAMLETAVRAAGERRGGLALIYGESGVGKTRLAREVIIKSSQWLAGGEQFIVRTGSCVAPGAGEAGATAAVASPLHPLRSVLATAADRARTSRSEADQLIGPRGKVLSAYAPELLDLPGQAEQQPPPSLPPDKARARVISALQETLWALAKLSPLLIVLDDLQWADDLTLSLLKSLTKAGLDDHGVLIVATYRSEEEETRPELTDLAGLPDVTKIPLGRLDVDSVEEMVTGMLGGNKPPRGALEALNRYSEGNPFFVAEYLLTAIEEGILRRDETGRLCFDARDAAGALSAMPLPHTVENLVGRRLDRLNAEERTLAEWAAVLGQELDDKLLRSGAHRGDLAMDALEALKARHLLEETEEGKLRFAHDKIREIAYQRIAFATRTELHRRAGEALERRYAAEPDKAQALGYHFAGAGRHDKAGKYFAQAADRAQQVYANGDAIRFYRAAINALTRAPRSETKLAEIAALQESLGDVLGLIGHQEEARGAYRAALDATAPAAHLALAQLFRKSGKTWEMRHDHAKALELYAQAEAALDERPALSAKPPPDRQATAPDAGDRARAWSQEWIQIQLERISVHYWLGDIELLCRRVEVLRPMVEQQGTALHRAHYLHALTQRNIRVERYVASNETVRYARECVAAYEAAGEAPEGHWVLAAKGSLAIILVLHDAFKKAEKPMGDALQAAEKIGDLEVQTRCLTYLTMIHRRLRQLDRAEAMAQKSLRLATQEQVREYAGAAWGNLAWVALQRGDYAGAEQAGRKALSLWEPLAHVYPFQWLARLPLCCVELTQGGLEDAIEQAQAVLHVGQQRLPKQLTASLEAAVTAFTQGHNARAKSALLRALQIALHHGHA